MPPKSKRPRESTGRRSTGASSGAPTPTAVVGASGAAPTFFSPNVILSGTHFQLFNDAYDAALDLGELARHLWGCELTTNDTIASESAALKDFMKTDATTVGGGAAAPAPARGGRGQQQQQQHQLAAPSLLSVAASASDYSAAAGDVPGAVLRIRFPRTVAYRDQEEVFSSDDEEGAEEDPGDDDGKQKAFLDAASGTAAASSSATPLMSMDDLPQLSLLSSLHQPEAFSFASQMGSALVGMGSQSHAAATPIFASTAFGGGAEGAAIGIVSSSAAGGGGAGSRQQQQGTFNLSSNVMQSTLFGGGFTGGVDGGNASFATSSLLAGVGGSGNSLLYPGGDGSGGRSNAPSGFSELYQSVMPSDAYGGGGGVVAAAGGSGRGNKKDPLSGEASVDDLMALSQSGDPSSANSLQPSAPQQGQLSHSAGDSAPVSAGGGGSLFDMAAKFGDAKIDLHTAGEAQRLLTADDLLSGSGKKGSSAAADALPVAAPRRRRTTLRRIVLESIFCTVTRRGGVSVFGPIPPSELPAVAAMVHEYVARALTSCCPWAVALSALSGAGGSSSKGGGNSPRAIAARLPPVSPMEMLACGSAASWNAHARGLLRSAAAARVADIAAKKAEKRREAALVEAAFGEASPANEDDGSSDESGGADTDGFALPFAPPKAKTKGATKVKKAAPPPPSAGGDLSDLLGALGAGGGGTGGSTSLAVVAEEPKDVLALRLERLRALLSLPLSEETKVAAATADEGVLPLPEGVLPKPPRSLLSPSMVHEKSIYASPALRPTAASFAAPDAMTGAHGLRVSNIMCHLQWCPAACAALTELRSGGWGESEGTLCGGSKGARQRGRPTVDGAAKPRHLTVAEFEAFVENVGRWSLMRLRRGQKEVESGAKPKAPPARAMPAKVQALHPSSASFSSSREARRGLPNASLGEADAESDGEGPWAPRGIIIVAAASADYCRFEWHCGGRAVEAVAQRRSATFRVVVAQTAADCAYVADTVIPVCLGLR